MCDHNVLVIAFGVAGWYILCGFLMWLTVMSSRGTTPNKPTGLPLPRPKVRCMYFAHTSDCLTPVCVKRRHRCTPVECGGDKSSRESVAKLIP